MSIKSIINNTIEKKGYKINRLPYKPFVAKDLTFDITYLDIGASGGLPEKWEKFITNDSFNLILVEPDAAQAEKIKTRYQKATVIPYALGSKREKANLHITYFQQCSSILEPNFEVLNRFPVKKWFEVVNKIEVNIHRFADLVPELKLPIPDFIKIDVQGYESEVLDGFGPFLDDVLCIELETHLQPIYKNQKTLPDLNNFMLEKGFMLRHIQPEGPFEGEVIEFDAYFIKRPEKLKSDLEKQKIDLWLNVNNLPKARSFSKRDKF